MPSKAQTNHDNKVASKQPSSKPTVRDTAAITEHTHPAMIIQRAMSDPRSLTPRDVLQLQRTIGNQAVQRLLTQAKPNDPESRSSTQEATSYDHDFSQISAPAKSQVSVQAKLMVSSPGDIYEQEADKVAERLMRTSATQSQDKPDEKKLMNPDSMQRPAALMREPSLQGQTESGVTAPYDLDASIQQAQGGGQRLADDIREPMEQSFGADFSEVRVHTGAPSDQLNNSLQARAFTTGKDIFFREGEYSPGSPRGRELLAHELTHVVQQSGSSQQGLPVSPVQSKVIQRWVDADAAIRLMHVIDISTVPELRSIIRSIDFGLVTGGIVIGRRVWVLLPSIGYAESIFGLDALELRAYAADCLAERLMVELASLRAPIAARMNAATTDAARRTEMTALRAVDAPLLNEIRSFKGTQPIRWHHPPAIAQDALLAAIQLEAVSLAEADLASPTGVEAAATAACSMGAGSAWCGFFVAKNYLTSSLDKDLRAGFFHVDNVEHYFTYHYAFGLNERIKKWIQADGAWHDLHDYHASRNSLRHWIDARGITSGNALDIRPGDVALIDHSGTSRPDHIVMVHSWDPATSILFTIGGNDSGYEVDTRPIHTAPPGETADELTRRQRLEAVTGQPLKPGGGGGHVGVGTQDLAHQPAPAAVEANQATARPRVRVFGIGRPSIVDFEDHAYDSRNNVRPDLRNP